MKKMMLALLLLIYSISSKSQIIYTNINPDITINSQVANDTLYIDLNQDGIDDFRVTCITWFVFIHNNCCQAYKCQIVGLQPQNQIAYDPLGGSFNCGRITLDTGYCVGSNYTYQNYGIFGITGPQGYCSLPALGIRYYFPLRMDLGGNTHYGWINALAESRSFTLYDMAFNTIPNSCLVMGQTITGIEPNEMNYRLSISPNPTHNNFTINIPNNFLQEENLTVSLYDYLGKQIQKNTQSPSDGKISINLEQVAKRIYTAILANKVKSYYGKIVFE